MSCFFSMVRYWMWLAAMHHQPIENHQAKGSLPFTADLG